MKKFYIDPKYATSVPEEIIVYKEESKNCTLFDIMKDPVLFKSTATKDHPNFTKLRKQLEKLGYIRIETRWWNGDQVLKPFILNNLKFKKDDVFPSASALYVSLALGHN